MRQNELIAALKEELRKEFGRGLDEGAVEQRALTQAIESSVYRGDEDPGEWSPQALAVIHCENGYIDVPIEPYWSEAWIRVTDALERRGFPVFCEAVNGAVAALYRA